MALTLDDVYVLMNHLIRGTQSTNIAKKMIAINEGYKYLQDRMIERGYGIEELLSTPTNITTTVNVNYVSLPSDFVALSELFYKTGSQYIPFDKNASRSYKELLRYVGQEFFDTSNTGVPQIYAIKRPYIYFDFHASATATDGIKIIYFKRPTELVAYDRLTISGASGNFTVGEVITGGDTSLTATVYAVGTNYCDVTTTSRNNNEFNTGETLTGGTSAETAIYVSMSEKPQELEVSESYKLILSTACAVTYLFMEDSPEAGAKNATLESLIDNMTELNNNNRDFSVRLG